VENYCDLEPDMVPVGWESAAAYWLEWDASPTLGGDLPPAETVCPTMAEV
jgi:hypothetical protein